MAPVSGHNKGGRRNWERPGSRPRGAPKRRAREDPPLREGPAGWERPGERRGARSRRGLGPHSPPTSPRRSPGAGPVRPRPPHLAAAWSLSPDGWSWAAAARRGRRKKGGREGRDGGREEVEWPRRRRAPPGRGGGQRKGEPNLTRPPRAQTLKSRSGARSPAGSDGGGAYARPNSCPPPSRPHPRPRSGPQIPAGSAAAPALASQAGSPAGWGLILLEPPSPALGAGTCWEL